MSATAENGGDTLQPPAPAPKMEPDEAERKVPLAEERRQALAERAESFVAGVVEAEPESEAFKEAVRSAHQMGNQYIREAANVSNRLLDKPVKAMDQGALSGDSDVSRSLIELRSTVESLDPSRRGDLFEPKKLFGFIPWGNKLRDYFREYQSAQSHIDAIIQSLYRGRDELQRDNASIEEEKRHLWEVMHKLEEYVYLGRRIDEALETRISEIEQQNEHKARAVREELLFYTRQKVQDLQSQLAVAVQGYMALDMIRKNNLELIKGVERATSVTISALRTATIVAQALTNQRLVLEQIEALNETTGDVIQGTSELMREQSGRIHEQAASSGVDLEKLQSAFTNIYATMDEMSEYKVKALDSMKETVDALEGEIGKARERLDRVQQEEAREAVGSGEGAGNALEV
ncbi:toxic anion resistance protein [Arhodomonas sp. SL1]|uniref:toxic anion resistance protein n=1 Tax=Arhodomonas sp. SL1 TaxID=3425691 RepID=UPI003F881D69